MKKDNSILIWLLVFVTVVITIIAGLNIYTVYRFDIGNSETTISTTLTIISILVTFIIGYQIYNAVESNKRIKDAEDKLDVKIKEYDTKLSDIAKIEEKLNNSMIENEINNHILKASLSRRKGEYTDAYIEYLFALALKLKLPVNPDFKVYINNRFRYRTDILICDYEYCILNVAKVILNGFVIIADDNVSHCDEVGVILDSITCEGVEKNYPNIKDNKVINQILYTYKQLCDVCNDNIEGSLKCEKTRSILLSYDNYIKTFVNEYENDLAYIYIQ